MRPSLDVAPPTIASGRGSRLITEDDRELVDLFSANGTTFLGCANPKISSAIAAQLNRVWITGSLPTRISAEARARIESLFPPGYKVAAMTSTGMEAFEFATRISREATGRIGLVGFDRNMHGKSSTASALGWDTADHLQLSGCLRIPYLHSVSESELMENVELTLSQHSVAAVFVEPIQGCGAGYMLSDEGHRRLQALVEASGSLLVFDEILTGCYRTGRPFYFQSTDVLPDIVLIGKALGNGFPVSAVVVRDALDITATMMPGSTFSGNSLAAAAVGATLEQMEQLPMAKLVEEIEIIIHSCFDDLGSHNVTIRGRGAMWVLDLPDSVDIEKVLVNVYESGVAIGSTRQQIRILPAATIDRDDLRRACTIVAESIRNALFRR